MFLIQNGWLKIPPTLKISVKWQKKAETLDNWKKSSSKEHYGEHHKDRHPHEARGSVSCDWQDLNRRLNTEKLNVYLIETALAEVVFFAKGYIIQAAFI